jgi:hypothetical protein
MKTGNAPVEILCTYPGHRSKDQKTDTGYLYEFQETGICGMDHQGCSLQEEFLRGTGMY